MTTAADNTDGYIRLAAGILAHAGKDAESGDISAVAFLRSEEAAWICEVLKFDDQVVERFARGVDLAGRVATIGNKRRSSRGLKHGKT